MGVCKCGKTVKETGTQCRRCAALNELGLKAGASAASIKSAYRLQVKAWHPDKYGKDIAQQWAAEEKTIRLNNAYKVLTSSSKKRDLPQSPRPSSPPETLRHHTSSTTPGSTSSKTPGIAKPENSARDMLELQTKESTTCGIPPSTFKQVVSHYPQPDYEKWKAEFDKFPISGTSAGKGLKKWIAHEEAQRTSNIEFMVNNCKSLGVEPNLEKFAKPEDVKTDLMRRLWFESAPNVEERTRDLNDDIFLVEDMEKLAIYADDVVEKLRSSGAKVRTQSGYLEVPLDSVIQNCIQLSSSIRKTSYCFRERLIDPISIDKKKLPYPSKIADCCMSLVISLEDRCRLSQPESHELIKHALLAHGCTLKEVTDFAEENVGRGTIRAKKEAIRKKFQESLQVIFSNGLSPVPIRFHYVGERRS